MPIYIPYPYKMPWQKPTIGKEEYETLEQTLIKQSQAQNILRREIAEASKGIDIKELLLLLVAVKLSKTPEGLKVLRDVAVQTIQALDHSWTALAKASTANPVTAWANPYLLSIIYERFGIVPSSRMAEFRVGLSIISGAEVAEDVVGAFASMTRIFGNAPPSDFPSQLDLGDTTYILDPRPRYVKEPATAKKKKA